MARKPKLEEHISLGEPKKEKVKDFGLFRSLKDVHAERLQLAINEDCKFTTRHFRAVSLFADGRPSEYHGIDYL
jgi:hypothetical protein